MGVGVYDDIRASVRRTGDSVTIDLGMYEFDAARGDALDLLRDLNAVLHPWGEPGDVPTAEGEYWVVVKMGDGEYVRAASFDTRYGWWVANNQWLWEDQRRMCELAKREGLRFCKRWTPEVPK